MSAQSLTALSTRERSDCMTWLRGLSVTTQTGCGAEQSTCVFVCERQQWIGCCTSHAYLYEGCAEGGCPSDSALHGSWPSKAVSERNPDWYAVSFQCHLRVCYCGICTSSITDTRGLSVLKAKSQYKPHLVSKQSDTQTQHIFCFVGRIF